MEGSGNWNWIDFKYRRDSNWVGVSGVGNRMSGGGDGMRGRRDGMSGGGDGMIGEGNGVSGGWDGMSGGGNGVSGEGDEMSGGGNGVSGRGDGMSGGADGKYWTGWNEWRREWSLVFLAYKEHPICFLPRLRDFINEYFMLQHIKSLHP